MMCRTSIFAFLAAAMTLAAGGVGITVYESVDEHIGSVTVSAGSQSETVSRNGNLTWGSWYIDTAYTASAANVDTGYTARWEVTKSGQATKEGAINEPITLSSAYSGCSLRFYGQPNTYKLTFVTGGTLTATYGQPMPPAVPPSQTGYTFDGYYTAENGGGTKYYNADGSSARNCDLTADTTMYPKWVANEYTLTFVTGGTLTAAYGQPMPKAEPPSKAGYTFAGYYTEPNGGGTQYYNADGTSARNCDLTANTTMYPKWVANEYTVTFQTGGELTATYDQPMPKAEPPSKTGYTFDGYYTAANGGGVQYYDANGTGVRNYDRIQGIHLYPKWVANKYTLTFVTGGTLTATYDQPMPQAEPPSKVGYTFAGYYTEPNGGGTQYYNADGTSARNCDLTADTTMYPKWVGTLYTVYLSEGGSVDVAYGSAMPPITPPSKAGYTFAGYYTAANGGGAKYYNADGTSAQNYDRNQSIYLHANWTANAYTVTLDKQGGSGGTSSVTATYDAAMPSVTIPTRTGYTFGGYYTEVDGGGTQYYAESGTSAQAWDIAGPTTLYARWIANSYEVAFRPNGADGGEMPNQSFAYGVPQQLNAAGFTYTGHAFEKWSSDTNYNYLTKYYADGATVTNLATGGVVNLYANWTGIVYTVSFDANGGEGEMDPIICTYTVPTNIPACTFTRDGWGFSGWTTNGADEVVYADRARVTNLTATAEVTLLACWTGVTYAVVLDARDPKGEDNGVFTNGMGEAVSILTNRYTVGDAWELPTSVTNINKHFSFVGWTYVDTNGVTVTVTESDAVPPPSVFGGTTNLVAAWSWVVDDLAAAVDAPELSFATRGTVGPQGKYSEPAYDAPWFVQTNYVHDSTNAVQSGALLENGGGAQKFHISWLTTTVSTNGVLTFWWRCSAPNLTLSPEYGDLQGYSFHFGRIEEGGGFTNLTTELTGDSGWRRVVCTNDVAGSVTFAWQFRFTDPEEAAAIGGTGWVDRVTWTPDGGTPVPVDVTSTHAVPYSWLSENFPDEYASASGDAEEIDRIAEGDSPNGKPMKVWQEYWAGTNPNDPNDLFRANIMVSNDVACITWLPDLSVTGDPKRRVYHVLCAPTPSAGWAVLQSNVEERLEVRLPVTDDSGASTNLFFKVELDWKESQKN